MMTAVTHFQQRLQQAIHEGATARRSLVRHTAGLPSEQLAALPPDLLRLLGSKGLIAVLEYRSATTRRDAPTQPATRPPSKGLRNPLSGLAVVVGVLAILGPVTEHLVPVLASNANVSRPIATTAWPACQRLDHIVDGCLYTVGGGGSLSLLDAANQLGITTEDFITINAHIPGPVSSTLPRGSQLVVWRDKLMLEGTTK